MTYPCPVTVSQLRHAIERDVLGLYQPDGVTMRPPSDWPGRFTSSAGTVLPGVFVENPDTLPRDWNPEGIICVIQGVPALTHAPSIGHHSAVETWDAMFSNYGVRESVVKTMTMLEIQRRLFSTFSAVTSTTTGDTDLALPSLTARIRLTTLQPLQPVRF